MVCVNDITKLLFFRYYSSAGDTTGYSAVGGEHDGQENFCNFEK
jgi:hypothetical protein